MKNKGIKPIIIKLPLAGKIKNITFMDTGTSFVSIPKDNGKRPKSSDGYIYQSDSYSCNFFFINKKNGQPHLSTEITLKQLKSAVRSVESRLKKYKKFNAVFEHLNPNVSIWCKRK